MVKNYTCEQCGKIFSQKGHYTNHLNRKIPCKPIENKLIEEKVEEKLQELYKNGDIEIKNKNLNFNNEININKMDNISKKDIPKPLLKWVGGKGQIIDILLKSFPKEINNYHEIFLGGGSVLIALLWAKNNEYIKINGSINVYDLNEALIGTYVNIRDNKDELYKSINIIKEEFYKCNIDGEVNRRKPKDINEAKTSTESYYYWIRSLYNNLEDKKSVESSVYFIFMNKTGFRGMYREGPNGMNIPYGHYKKFPEIINKTHLNEISELIQQVNFYYNDFSKSFEYIKEEKNFIYLDPPYAPENDKSFVGYNKEGFDIKQHELLFNLTKKASEKNNIMMSNSNVKLVKDNFPKNNYKVEEILCRRAINSKNPSAKTKEVIITNY